MRRAGWVLAVVAVLALSLAALQALLAREVERRLGDAIAEATGVTGGMRDVTVCLPCGSYTVHDLALRSSDASGDSPLLSARAMEVGVRVGSLLFGAQGEVVLREPTLHVDVGREAEGGRTALDVSWAKVGRRLLPWPIDGVSVQQGALRVHHQGFEQPVTWEFDAIEGEARDLRGRAGRAPRLEGRGEAFGSGRFQLAVEFADPDAQGFRLTGAFRDVPLRALDTYLEQHAGIGVEGGQLTAAVRIDANASGWKGLIRCALPGLDIFAAKDLAEGPVRAFRDAIAGGIAGLASLDDGDEPLRLRLEVEKQLGREGAVDAWQTLALLVRESLLMPFTLPLDAVLSAAARLGPEDEPEGGPPDGANGGSEAQPAGRDEADEAHEADEEG